MTMGNEITGLILAGGKSRRFGSDKARHEIAGLPMVQRVYTALNQVADPVLISVANPSISYELPAVPVYDDFPGAGPLSGMHAGFSVSTTKWVLVCAVDMPFIDARSLRLIAQAALSATEHVDAVISTSRNRIQPLPGCYKSHLVDGLRKHLEREQLSLMNWLDTLRTSTVHLDEHTLQNINAPTDLQ